MASDETFRELLSNSQLDVWGIIDAAITFALKDHPDELKLRRDGIVKRLNDDEHNSSSDSDEDEAGYPQNEFGDFDKHKEEHCFKADQFWAYYQYGFDGMPRLYFQIKKVNSSPFSLELKWLVADPESLEEIAWVQEGLPVACGKFKLLPHNLAGNDCVSCNNQNFSHQIAYVKDGNTVVIYPKKGEIWALYKDWDIKWSSNPDSHMEFKYEVVEVLSDFDKEHGIRVAYMAKVEGFVSVFRRTSRVRLAECCIPSSQLFRFSHYIPSQKLTGKEGEGVPVGSFELDTYACFHSNGSDSDETMCCIQTSPRGIKRNLKDSAGYGPSSEDDVVDLSSPTFKKRAELSLPSGVNVAIVFHDFNSDKSNWSFQNGQIWALNIGHYGQIKKIESSPTRLHVHLLELCSDVNRPYSCGLFRASKGGRQIFHQDSLLYPIKADVNGKNKFSIYPREKEIWVLMNKEDAQHTWSDLSAGDCSIVEVVKSNGSFISILALSRVPGYKSVFRALEIQNSEAKKVMEIPLADSKRFFCRVPAFLLTVEQDGCLNGSWELDLAEFPGLLQN